MAILGLLMLAASIGAAVSIALNNTDAAPFDVFGWTVSSLSPGGLMLLGIALGVAGLVGLLLLLAGLKRSRRRRHEIKTVEQSRSRVDELEEENIRLREEAQRRDVVVSTPTRTDPVEVRDGGAVRDASAASTLSDAGAVRLSEHARADSLTNVTEGVDTAPAGNHVADVDGDDMREHGNRVFGRGDT